MVEACRVASGCKSGNGEVVLFGVVMVMLIVLVGDRRVLFDLNRGLPRFCLVLQELPRWKNASRKKLMID